MKKILFFNKIKYVLSQRELSIFTAFKKHQPSDKH